MSLAEHLERWRENGVITATQHDTIAAIVLKQRFSLFLELNALFYAGVVFVVAGLAWTARTYFAALGDAVVLAVLSGLLAASLYYCFTRPPTFFSDYVLYAGCLILAVELSYVETRFDLLREAWDHYLLFSSSVFFALAYRFDNRFVLSLALSSLAAWFGLRFNRFGLVTADTLRLYGIAYGVLIAGAGTWLWTRGVMPHFLQTYLHVGANVVLASLVSGLGNNSEGWLYLTALLVVCAIAIYLGVSFRRFAFVAYGTLYGYAGGTYQLLYRVQSTTVILSYIVVSGTIVVLAMVVLARRVGKES